MISSRPAPAYLLLMLCLLCGPLAAADRGTIPWLSDEAEAFRLAREQQRPVLLYLEAVWCHWCHVIDRETYGDPIVAGLLRDHFIPLRIDQDQRPDLANRYRDYGWPATIFFTPDGVDMVKRQGYIAPGPMASLLRAIIEDPTPEAAAALDIPEVFAAESSLPSALKASLEARHLSTHDAEHGGLKLRQKFLDRDSVELDLVLAGDGDAAAALRARRSLNAGLKLIDPVWGGVYQYSTGGDWERPHFEKLATIQGEYLRLYALAHARLGDAAYLGAVEAIRSYLDRFLKSPEGAYYTSQDADRVPGEKAVDYFALDDAGRRSRGEAPRVDRHRYARENGVIIEALATVHELQREEGALEAALRATRWIEAQRSLEGGGFRHGDKDPAGPYLGDTLAMGRAYLALYKATAEREWLHGASRAADFIDDRFRHPGAGYASAVAEGAVLRPVPQIDENMALARFANLLHHFTGRTAHRAMAERAMRYLATPAVALDRVTEAGILLADRELGQDPLHLTVVGDRDDPLSRELFEACARQPGWYKRAEWWDLADGPLPNPDVDYPRLRKPAAFVCTDRRCSLPLFDAGALRRFIEQDLSS